VSLPPALTLVPTPELPPVSVTSELVTVVLLQAAMIAKIINENNLCIVVICSPGIC
jgi:hypothetical protein